MSPRNFLKFTFQTGVVFFLVVMGFTTAQAAGLGRRGPGNPPSAETFQQPIPVSLDSLEGVLGNAMEVPVGTQAAVEEANLRAAQSPGPDSIDKKASGSNPSEGAGVPLKIRVTPVVATPIHPRPLDSKDDAPRGALMGSDRSGVIRYLTLFLSVSTFILSGGLLIRQKLDGRRTQPVVPSAGSSPGRSRRVGQGSHEGGEGR